MPAQLTRRVVSATERAGRVAAPRFAAAVAAAMAAAIGSIAPVWASAAPGEATIAPRSMPAIASIDERFLSYNVEMAEVVGGTFWKPYSSLPRLTGATGAASGGASSPTFQIGKSSALFEPRPPIDLTDARLRRLAAALGPAYVRVSGTWANSVYFDDHDAPAPAKPPKGFQSILTRAEWKGVIDFAGAVDARIVTSFAISPGVRNSSGIWTPEQARRLLEATKSLGGAVAAAEFFNEPTYAAMGGAPPGYDAADYARDFSIFRRFARSEAPEMRIVGPGSVGEGIKLMPGPLLATQALLSAYPRPVFDIYSYHSYAAASERCARLDHGIIGTSRAAALSEDWLATPDRINAFYEALRDRFEPGRQVWVTETADTACGGDPWADTFLDTFRFLDELGRLAQRGVQVVFHNTFASSDYGLIDQDTHEPRPNYWAALLWRRLMGRTVLDAGAAPLGLHVYAQCLRGHPGAVALLLINSSRDRPQAIDLPIAAEGYTLTALRLDSIEVRLNGQPLALEPDGALPQIAGKPVAAGRLELAPLSIIFLAVYDAANPSCR